MPKDFQFLLSLLSKSNKGKPIANQPNLHKEVVTDKNGRRVTKWKRAPSSKPPVFVDRTTEFGNRYKDRVSFEVVPGEGAPSSDIHPTNLSYEQSLAVTKHMMPVVEKALHIAGVNVSNLSLGPGGWESDPVNPSPQAELKGDKKKARQASALMGLILEQTGMFMTTPSINGASTGIAIYEKSDSKLSDPKTVSAFWEKLRELSPRIGYGFMPLLNKDGAGNNCAGIAIINSSDATSDERWGKNDFDQFENSIQEAAKHAGLEIHEKMSGKFRVDSELLLNDWNTDKNGEAYREIIGDLLSDETIDRLLEESQHRRKEALSNNGISKAGVANQKDNIHYENIGGKKHRVVGKKIEPLKVAQHVAAPVVPENHEENNTFAEKHIFTRARSEKNLKALRKKIHSICEEEGIEPETFKAGLEWADSVVNNALIIAHGIGNLETAKSILESGQLSPHHDAVKIRAAKEGVDITDYNNALKNYQNKVSDTLSKKKAWDTLDGAGLMMSEHGLKALKGDEHAKLREEYGKVRSVLTSSNTGEDQAFGLNKYCFASMLPEAENIGSYGRINIILKPDVIGQSNVFATPYEAVLRTDYFRNDADMYMNHAYNNGQVKDAWKELAALYYSLANRNGYDPKNAHSSYEAMENVFLEASNDNGIDLAGEHGLPEPMELFDWEVKINGPITKDMIHKIGVVNEAAAEENEDYNELKPIAESQGITIENWDTYQPMLDDAKDTVSKAITKTLMLKKAKKKYDFSSTQLNMPAEWRTKLKSWMKGHITTSMLAKDGIEKQSHITVKYGLQTDDSEQLRQIASGFEPIEIKLGVIDIFSTNDEFDVLIVKIESKALQSLNSIIAKKMETVTTFRNYVPHLTLAYVKKGSANHLVGRRDFAGKKVVFDSFYLSSRDHKMTEIPFSKGKVDKAVGNLKDLIHYTNEYGKKKRVWGKRPPKGTRALVNFKNRESLKNLGSQDMKSSDFPSSPTIKEWMRWASNADNPAKLLPYLKRTGQLEKYPEIGALFGVPQEAQWHPEGTVEIHTGLVMNEAANIAKRDRLSSEERGILVLAALCHDFGKATKTHYTENNGKVYVSSKGHEAASVPFAKRFLERLGADKNMIDKILPIVEHHMAHVDYLNGANERSVKRLANKLVPATVQELARLVEADTSGRPPLPKGLPKGGKLMVELASKVNVLNGVQNEKI